MSIPLEAPIEGARDSACGGILVGLLGLAGCTVWGQVGAGEKISLCSPLGKLLAAGDRHRLAKILSSLINDGK